MSTHNPNTDAWIMEAEDDFERRIAAAQKEIEGLTVQRDELAKACAAMLATCVWPLGQSKADRFGVACEAARKAIAKIRA